jgi:hypothetical protein
MSTGGKTMEQQEHICEICNNKGYDLYWLQSPIFENGKLTGYHYAHKNCADERKRGIRD